MMRRFCSGTRIQAGWNFRKGQVRRINVELDRVKTGRAIDTVSQDRVSEETIRNLGKLCADHHVMARTNA